MEEDMNTLKRMMIALLVLLPLATGTAFADTEHGYSRIFIFGASFMDSGNHFALSGETAHPPFDPISFSSYGVGGHHFSNGRTWVEVMAQEMELTDWAKPAYRDPAFGNYAVGYALAREFEGDVRPSLYDQVQDWIDNGYCTGDPSHPMTDTLFVVDTAFFDLLDVLQGQDPELILGGMIESLATNIGVLYGCGASNLLVSNIPPMGTSPMVPADAKDAANGLSWLYNLYVQQQVITFYSGLMNVSVVDIFTFFTGLIGNQENFGLTNVTETCVTPFVLDGAFCKNRDEYLFWDPLHPTKKVHELFAEFALAQLP
jgi:phospholipase/lecithinase/hemolysin